MRAPVLPVLLLCACASGQGPLPPGADIALTDAELQAEAASLRALHVSADLLLRAPYAPPYSSRSLIVPSSWYRAAPPAGVAPRDLAADLVILERVLPLAYVARDRAGSRGLEWPSFFRDWRAELLADPRPRIPLEEAFAPLRRWREALADPVSGPVTGAPHPRSHVSLLAGPVREPCDRVRLAAGGERALLPQDPAQHPRLARIAREGGTRLEGAVYLAYPAPVAGVRCARGWTPATPVESAGDPGGEPGFRMHDGGVAYLRVPSLQAGALEPVAEPAQGAAALILDLRGAAGGDGAALAQAIAPWIAKRPRVRPARVELASCLVGSLRWGTQRREGGSLDAVVPAVQRPRKGSCAAPLHAERGTWSHGSRRFDPAAPGPAVLVVVDAGCRGACEQLVLELGASPRTLIAGVNTAGALQFGSAGTLVLPRSRVPFVLATELVDPYGDGRSFDGYGLDVDVVLATPENASEAALVELARTVTR